MPVDPVTIGELSRRFDEFKHDIDKKFEGLSGEIKALSFVNLQLYERDQRDLDRRLKELEQAGKDAKAEEEANRKWKKNTTLTAIVFPVIVALLILFIQYYVAGK